MISKKEVKKLSDLSVKKGRDAEGKFLIEDFLKTNLCDLLRFSLFLLIIFAEPEPTNEKNKSIF